MAEEISTDIVEAPLAVVVEETDAERDERLKREDYARRNAEAIASREEILRRNGVLKPDEPFSMDTEAAIRLRCCGS